MVFSFLLRFRDDTMVSFKTLSMRNGESQTIIMDRVRNSVGLGRHVRLKTFHILMIMDIDRIMAEGRSWQSIASILMDLGPLRWWGVQCNVYQRKLNVMHPGIKCPYHYTGGMWCLLVAKSIRIFLWMLRFILEIAHFSCARRFLSPLNRDDKIRPLP